MKLVNSFHLAVSDKLVISSKVNTSWLFSATLTDICFHFQISGPENNYGYPFNTSYMQQQNPVNDVSKIHFNPLVIYFQ